ncbi:MAG: C25 family cysteine peptidase [Candidatus Delongbacteria bacterium]
MKKILAVIFSAACMTLFAGDIKLTDSSKTGYSITSENPDGFTIELSVGEVSYTPVMTEKGEFVKIGFSGSQSSYNIGEPDLPVFRELTGFPEGSEPTVKILSYDEKEIFLGDFGISSKIYPSQPGYSKSSKPEERKFIYNENAYNTKSYTASGSASITKSGNMRGVDIGVLEIRPMTYNPSSNSLIIRTNIKAEIIYNGSGNDLYGSMAENYSPFFENAFSKLINLKASPLKSDLVQYPVTYLILANANLEGNAKLQEFIDWKTQKGFNVITNFVSSSSSISVNDAWVESQYGSLNPKPSFLLIVGDHDGTYGVLSEVNPVLGSAGGVTRSDLLYGVMGTTGNLNRIPSIYIGRFSVRSEAELAAQVDKTIWYEKTQFTTGADLSYLSNVVGVAGVDGSYASTHGNPQISYGMTYYFNDTYRNPLDNTLVNITGIPYYYPASDAAGVNTEIINYVSSGISFYNYTAHGYNGGFADPSFSITNVNSLTNSGKYPLVVGNCCLTGSFGDAECFGESWLNAADKGGIGFIGASMSTYWDEDLAMGVGLAASNQIPPPLDITNPGMYDGVMALGYSTQAGMKHVGLMAVEQLNSSITSSYWSSYHLFGDPSLMVYTGIPGVNTVVHDSEMTFGENFFTIQALKGSYVAITDDSGTLHGAGIVDNSGNADITIDPFINGYAHITVTSQFKKPYFTAIPVSKPTGPYLLENDYIFSTVNFGENGTIDLEIKNIGTASSESITVTASTESEYLTLSDFQETYPDIAAADSVKKTSVFSYSISANVPDKQKIIIDILAVDDFSKSAYNSSISFFASAPKLATLENIPYSITDPSDIVPVTFNVTNSGSASVSNLKAKLTEINGLDIKISEPVEIQEILSGSSVDINFRFTWDSELLPSDINIAKFNLILSNAIGFSHCDTTDVVIGITDGFETADFTHNDWIQDGDAIWTIDNGTQYDGLYSARSGIITHNQYSRMSLTYNFYEGSSISFYIKVSSESSYDFLSFYIDDAQQNRWSGDIGWIKATYDIPEGTHSIHWQYNKDSSVSAGLDCGWVDNIIISGIIPEEKNDLQNVNTELVLYGNYPNPFNPLTDIKFYISKDNEVKLYVYNLTGQLVKKLVDERLNSGIHVVKFNASSLNSGMYFYVLHVGNEKLSKKMLLVK